MWITVTSFRSKQEFLEKNLFSLCVNSLVYCIQLDLTGLRTGESNLRVLLKCYMLQALFHKFALLYFFLDKITSNIKR